MERSTLIVATTLHNKPATEFLREDVVEVVAAYSPTVFGEGVGKGLLEGRSGVVEGYTGKEKVKERV